MRALFRVSRSVWNATDDISAADALRAVSIAAARSMRCAWAGGEMRLCSTPQLEDIIKGIDGQVPTSGSCFRHPAIGETARTKPRGDERRSLRIVLDDQDLHAHFDSGMGASSPDPNLTRDRNPLHCLATQPIRGAP